MPRSPVIARLAPGAGPRADVGGGSRGRGAAAGGAALLRRRLARALPPSLFRDRSARPGDAGRVALATGALAAALAERGFADSAPLVVREGVRQLDVAVSCPPGDARALAALGPALARRLGCEVEALASGPTRVAVALSWRGRASAAAAARSPGRPVLVVPVGASGDAVVYLNLRGAGTVRLEGDGRERRRLLRSWIAALPASAPPEEISLHMDGELARLLAPDQRIPRAAELAGGLDAIVRGRSHGADRSPAVVAIVDLSRATGEPSSEAIRSGPACGVYVICCVEPGEEVAWLPDPGALIALRGAVPGSGGEPSLILRTRGDRPLPLGPVMVRAAVPPGGEHPARGEVESASSPGPPPPPRGAAPTVPAGAPPLAPADRAAASDGGEPRPAPRALSSAPGERGRGRSPGAGSGAPAGEDGRPQGGSTLPVPAPARAGEPSASPSGASRAGGEGPGRGATAALPPLEGRRLREPAPVRADAARAAPLFTVRCLGRFEVEQGGEPVRSWPRHKSRELLALLAAQGGTPLSRESVVEALWPEEPWDDARRHVAANVVSSLRRVVRAAASDRALAVVITERGSYRLQPGLFRVDLDLFGEALRRAPTLPDVEALLEYEGAARLYGGEFLEGELFPWLEVSRADCRRRLVEGVRRGAAIAGRLGERERAAALYRVVLEHEPTDEGAARGLMRLLAASGDVNEARRVHRRLSAALREDLDDPAAEPSSETEAVLARALAGEFEPTAAVAAAPGAHPPGTVRAGAGGPVTAL